MSVRGRLLAAAIAWCCVAAAQAAPDFGPVRASADARFAAAWVLAGSDHQGQPFAVVDKRDARIYVFESDGRLLGASPVLIGLAPGDLQVGDPARRAPAELSPAERTTPAGRFAAEPGRNDKGEAIVWIDYGASLAIHRLRPGAAHERRAARLASPTPADNRVSSGCVVVPVAFWESVVAPTLGARRGVVYVLPEAGSVRDVLAAWAG